MSSPTESLDFPEGKPGQALTLLRSAQLALCIVATGSNYELCEADDVPAAMLLESGLRPRHERRFVGVLAMVAGHPQSSLLEYVPEAEIRRLSAIFVPYVAFVHLQRAAHSTTNNLVH